MYEYAVERRGENSLGTSSLTISTTPRRKLRESSIGSTSPEDEVDDAGERGRRDTGQRDEGEDAAARRTFNDTPDPSRHGRAARHERGGDEGAAGTEAPVPDDGGRDAEAESGECPPAPAYRRRPTQREDERRHDQRDEVSRACQQRTEGQNEKRSWIEAPQ